MKRESAYQRQLIKEIKRRLPGAIVLKNDTSLVQGILDLTILWRNEWAMLEVKRNADAPHQPNQEYYVRMFNEMSFAAFIYPENEEAVLNELQQELETRWATRLSQSE